MLRRFFLSLLGVLAATAALAQEAPDALVKRTADEILAIVRQDKDLQAGNPQKVVALAEQKVLPYFDFERMTRLAVGRGWRQASPEQRQALTSAFRTMLVRTYSTSLSQYRNQTIEVKPLKMAPADTDVTVRTQVIQQGGPPIPIDYAMEKQDNQWKVYDVIVDGARDDLPRQLQRPDPEERDRRAHQDAAGAQPVGRRRRGGGEEVNDTGTAEVLEITGALSFETLPGVLERTAQFVRRPDVPDALTIDFKGVGDIDSSAVALLLEWRRQAAALGKRLAYVNLPPNLLALANLYGVADLIQPRA